ncbi:uncharacterized protein LOC132628976 [Lycium barbarum]|uniref:uncharacterized protein LOC132628976 n=1 Tax=Lycium barbarum TaxID=112863 RepID=UPI00293F7167|nr:uncharacterized protein LOC132628976 [Lycium barbarum]
MVKGIMPKHHFILWMALQMRPNTVDRLLKWGIRVPEECVLCSSTAMETHSHLYFDCQYSRAIWQKPLIWMGCNRQIGSWLNEVEWVSKQVRHKKVIGDILGTLFSATTYHVWIERKNQRFQQSSRTSEERLKEIACQIFILAQ